jgi:pimeloyl-ACP methyl ester carboxylesterase
VREYPVFVPVRDGHLAAVVAVPDAPPRGLVLLQTGLGASRSHRFGLWTRTARRLADEHQLASIRWEYLGIGDSSGELEVWRETDLPVEDLREVARLGVETLGVERVAVAGNCIGSWASLAFAAAETVCVGVVLIRMPLIIARSGSRSAGPWTRRALDRHPRMRAMAKRATRRRPQVKLGFGRHLPKALEHADVLMMYGERDFTFERGVQPAANRLLATLPPASRARFRLDVIPASERMSGFEDVGLQDRLIDAVVEWLGGRFPRGQERFEDTSRAMS